MTIVGYLPPSVQPLAGDESFHFACHKGVECFTECCRMLELSLTPYDVLRLRVATGKSSGELLDQYIIMEQDEGEPFPRFYLSMVDDGRASCVFVTGDGCRVYGDRPSACRTYPLGRGVTRDDDNNTEEQFVLLKEQHCLGFQEPDKQTSSSYMEDQKLAAYNSFNDGVSKILQHEKIRKGFRPSQGQCELFVLALYDIDTFRSHLTEGRISSVGPEQLAELADDEALLRYAMDWLYNQLFTSTVAKTA